MKRIKYTEILTENNINTINKTIKDNGVIVYPTDTLYGLGGNYFSSSVLDKVDALKMRKDLPYSVAVSGIKMLLELVKEIPDIFYNLFENLLPGKFTFLFKASPEIDKRLLKSSQKIGIRIPNLPDLLKVIEILEVPLISTSVNQSGQQPVNDPAQIITQFPAVDLLIDAGTLSESQGSTVVDLTETPVKCIRKGDDYHKLIKLGIQMVIE